ncbi:GDP-mannose 4,6-dehydratase [Candidatus Bathyarchaeota archaeon]|nr:GDP-mannose 4,6-dehydratase [Candidatus Bathyarchaeota archaeon]
MKYKGKKILVTGGAGFIGSYIVDFLMASGASVVVFDNLSVGERKNIKKWLHNPNFTLIVGDLLKAKEIEKAVNPCELVFHLAANPEVRLGIEDPRIHFEQNIVATYNLLEAMRKSKEAKTIVFTSSSAVYGDATSLPTTENYGPLMPISLYGASKLAGESLIYSYCHTFDMQAVVYRFANIVGSRSKHGVIYDFIQKLRANPRELEVLGDGTQTKSFLLVDDCVEGLLFGLEHLHNRFELFNIGSEDRISVREVAKIVIDELGLKNVKLKFTGGVNGGRGWKGDVKHSFLAIDKIKSLGWKPRHNSKESVRLATRMIKAELESI